MSVWQSFFKSIFNQTKDGLNPLNSHVYSCCHCLCVCALGSNLYENLLLLIPFMGFI